MLAGNLLHLLEERIQHLQTSSPSPVLLSRLCHFAVHLLDPDALKDAAPREAWRVFFSFMAQAMKSARSLEAPPETKHLPERCLRRMHVLDTTSKWGLISGDDEKPSFQTYYKFWLRSPKRKNSIFEDELILALTRINPEAAPYIDESLHADEGQPEPEREQPEIEVVYPVWESPGAEAV